VAVVVAMVAAGSVAAAMLALVAAEWAALGAEALPAAQRQLEVEALLVDP